MNYFKGFIFGIVLLVVANFFGGFLDKCTLTTVKGLINHNDSTEIKVDSVGEDVVNLNIAKYLQGKYGADSLMITSVSVPSTVYEYYVSGIKGVRKLDNPSDRVKKVTFTKGKDEFRIMVVYDSSNGEVKAVENDSSPVNTINPIQTEPNPIQPSQIQTDTTKTQKPNENNQDIGKPTRQNNGGFNNESDV